MTAWDGSAFFALGFATAIVLIWLVARPWKMVNREEMLTFVRDTAMQVQREAWRSRSEENGGQGDWDTWLYHQQLIRAECALHWEPGDPR